MTRRILHLTGSPTDEFHRQLSLTYARGCLEATGDHHRPTIVHLLPGGRWRFPRDLTDDQIAAAPDLTVAEGIARIAGLAPDLMLPQLFCHDGMTHLRALFDVLGIPYVGNRPDAMALTADKARARAVVAAAGVAVPEGEVLRRGEEPTLPPPVVVKPCTADNSVGIRLVHDPGDLPAALEAALEHDDRILVERFVELGREVRCGVLERNAALHVLPLEEYAMDPRERPIRAAADKLRPTDDGLGLDLVAKGAAHAWIVDPADPATQAVGDAARLAYRALGCRHYGLFDFRLDPTGRPWFLEASLYCSFSPQSVLATMAHADGISPTGLLAATADQALGHPGDTP